MIRKKMVSVVVLTICLLVGSGMGSIYAQAGKITLQMMLWSSPEHNVKQIVKKFESQNPNIDVVLHVIPWDHLHDKATITLIGREKLDIIYYGVGSLISWAEMGFLHKLDEYISQPDIDDFYSSALEMGMYEGNLYGIPNRITPTAAIYNKGLYETAGLDPESYPRTWEEFLGYCARLTLPEKKQYGYPVIGRGSAGDVLDQIFSFICQNKGKVLNEDRTKALVNEKPAVEAVKFWGDLVNRWHVTPPGVMENSDEENIRLFNSGKIGIIWAGPWIFSHIERDAPELLEKGLIGTSLLPKGKQMATRIDAVPVMISEYTKYPDEAFKFVKFMTSTDMVIQYCRSLPPRKSAVEAPRFKTVRLKPFFEMAKFGKPINFPKLAKIQNILFPEFQNVLLEDKTSQEAMNDAAAEIDRILAE